MGWSQDPGPPNGGEFPRHFFCIWRKRMSNKKLSIFIDESGDFGEYSPHSPYYLVTMVLHDQSINISEKINAFYKHINNNG